MRQIIILILSALIGSQSVRAAGQGTQEVEIFQQKHAYLGNLELVLAPDAVRISENVNGTIVTSRGPLWKVYVYNKRNKLYYDMTLEVWKKHGLRAVWVMMANTSEWPIVKTGSEKLIGRDVDVYVLPADPNARAKLRMHKPIDFNYGHAGEYLADKKPGAAERATVMVQLYKLPDIKQIPLMLMIYNPGNTGFFGVSNARGAAKQYLLQTFSAKKAVLPKNTFDLPAGYKRAKDDSEVTISKSSSDSLDSIVRDMGLGEKFYNKPKQK